MSADAPAIKPEWTAPIESRKERADYYFQTILEDQREWYSQKATTHKKLHTGFAISVIVLGAVVSCLQALEADWVRYLTAIMGAGITIIRAIDTLMRPAETWQSYRKASENMRREYRMYINGADVYSGTADEKAAYLLLVSRVETVIAEEQQLFWQYRDKTPPHAGEADKATEG